MKHLIKSTFIFILIFLFQSVSSLKAQELFLTAIPTDASLTASIRGDFYVKPQKGSASSAQSGEGIEKSFDGDMNTLYHSSWNNTVFPVHLDYMFADTVSQIDYLVYYPRTSGTNGNFKEVEIWYAAGGQPLTKYGDYDFQGNGSPSAVVFTPALINPDTIRFIVKSGTGDNGTGFASCAEMEFYRKNSNVFDYGSIFKDETCSELKDGITIADINAVNEEFYKKLAANIFYGDFDPEFRVQEYRAWVHPDRDAALFKTAPYSLRDNPTGIYVAQGEDLIVFVSDTQGRNVSLLSQDLSTGGFGTQQTYPLTRGLNKIKAKAKGLLYVQYYADDYETAPKVKINFVTGIVNGYFDSQKHTAADWDRLLNKALATPAVDFDLVGRFSHLTFSALLFQTCASLEKISEGYGLQLIDKWDDMVRLEHEFMGLYKHYGRGCRNRLYGHADYNTAAAWMYAGSYHTGYSPGAQSSVIRLRELSTNPWGPAHEVGHVNQVRPGVRWLGMTEVTTNIYSLHVQTTWGNRSRLHTDGVYAKAFDKLWNKGISHNDATDANGVDVWCQLVPFWQLKLYLVDVLGKEDFYKDLFHHYMTTANPTTPATDGKYQLNFVRVACDVAQLDLTDFFEKWGFLTPINKTVSDYGSSAFIVTQEQIDALKAEIAAKGYPEPPEDFSKITDDTVNNYK